MLGFMDNVSNEIGWDLKVLGTSSIEPWSRERGLKTDGLSERMFDWVPILSLVHRILAKLYHSVLKSLETRPDSFKSTLSSMP